MVPFGKKLHVTLQGALETDVVDRMFTIAGLIYGVSHRPVLGLSDPQNGRNNTFRFKVWIPDNPRWANLPLPARGQVIMVDGEITRRDHAGMYIIELVDVSLPTNTNKRVAVPSSPATSPVKRKQPSRTRPTVQQVENGSPFQGPEASGLV